VPSPAARVRTLPEYPLAAIPQRKRDLLARGVDVIDLGAGDADLAPPPAVVEALDRAARDPSMSRYGFGLGLPAFREAISAWMARRFGLKLNPLTEVVPLIGSKEGIAHIAFGFAEPGDVCVIPEPGYLAYLGGAVLADATPHVVALRQRNGFLLELDELPRHVLARTRIVYVNYPNNPTSATAPRDYLERLVGRCRELDILLVYDNAYSELAYDAYRPASIFEVDGARDVAVEFHSLSKTYNMTGWRCGWAVARPELAGVLSKVKSFIDTGAFMAVQAAGIAALESWSDFLPGNVEIFRTRRDAAVSAFRANGFACDVPRATMYLWVALPDGLSSAAFAERLMSDEGVIVLPGSAFGTGGEGFFRVSFVVPPGRLTEAASRAGRVLASFGASVA
jgi:LL-diaminopimelate aminotransferase